MTEKAPMTVEGEKALRAEHDHLTKNVRIQISKEIAAARELGDLKENAEYHAAREQQSFVEGRIQDIEGKLSHSQVIDISTMPPGTRVIFGCTVVIINMQTDDISKYRIVGDDEADVNAGKISYLSPIAKALIGKHVGDCVQVITPSGEVEYEIDKVYYA